MLDGTLIGLLSKHKVVTLLDFVHKCRARWGGGAEPARRPDGLGRFFFTGVAEEHWDVYPHLDEITGLVAFYILHYGRDKILCILFPSSLGSP